jgi:hypothetical protein
MRSLGHIILSPSCDLGPLPHLRLADLAGSFPFSEPLVLSAVVTGNTREPSRAALARAHHRKRAGTVNRFLKLIRRHLDYAKHETLRNIEHFLHVVAPAQRTGNAAPGGVATDIIFDLQRFEHGFFIAIRNQSAQTLQLAGNELYQEIGLDDVWRLPDPMVLDFLARRQNLLKDVPLEIWNEVRLEIIAGIEAGDSIDEMANRIDSKFAEIDKGRAETVASTETGAAYGFSRDQAMRVAGVRYKQWLTSHLQNVRPAHAAAEHDSRNQRVPIDEAFHVGGERLMYPGDPHGSAGNVINCHCIALAIPPDERAAA